MFKDFQWPKPEEEADEKLIYNVRERGCHTSGWATSRLSRFRSAWLSTTGKPRL